MNCMKCGAELKEDQVFCDECLANMARYPVRPNVVVQLPPQQPVAAAKKKRSVKKERKPEDVTRHLRSVIRWLCLLLAVALLAFGFVSFLLLRILDNQSASKGKLLSYNTVSQMDVSRETFF